jgi:hypothetical protein
MTVHLDRRGVASTGDTEYGCSSGAPAAERGLATSVSAEFARPPRPPARKVEPHGSPDRLPALLAARLAQLLLGGVALGLAAGGDLAIMLRACSALQPSQVRRISGESGVNMRLPHTLQPPMTSRSLSVTRLGMLRRPHQELLLFGWHNRTSLAHESALAAIHLPPEYQHGCQRDQCPDGRK